MRRSFFSLLLSTILFLPAGAQAQSLEAEVRSASFQPGDTATIEVRGDAMGASGNSVNLRMTFDPTVATLVNAEQEALTSNGVAWTTGDLVSDASSTLLLNQLAGLTPQTPDGPVRAWATLRIDAPGDLGLELTEIEFFGLTEAFVSHGDDRDQVQGRRIPYQGILQGAGTSTRLEVSLFGDDGGLRWGPELHDIELSNDGEFALVMGTTELDIDQNGRPDLDELEITTELYVEIAVVDGTTRSPLDPRQPLPPALFAAVASSVSDGSVDAAQFKTGSVQSLHFARNGVRTEHIAPSSISSAHIADEEIGGREINSRAISTAHLVDAANGSGVESTDFIPGSIQAADIEDLSIPGTALVNRSITHTQIAEGAVGSEELDDETINGQHFHRGSLFKGRAGEWTEERTSSAGFTHCPAGRLVCGIDRSYVFGTGGLTQTQRYRLLCCEIAPQ